MLNAGIQYNVVPEVATAGVDMRIAPTVDLQVMETTIRSWCSQEQVDMDFVQSFWGNRLTLLDDNNREWQILKQVAAKRCIP